MQDRPILVIDNEASAIKLITGTLQPMGYSILTASSGDEGLAMAKAKSPSLIFLNLAVPGTDGLKICKSFMSIIDAPLILLTMREGKYDPRYKSQYGIVDFLKKPINPQELTAKISEFAPSEAGLEDAEAVEAGEVDSIEISEEDAPSAAELAATVASYDEDEGPLTPLEEVAEAAEIIEAVPEDEELVEAAEIEEAAEAVVAEEEAGEWAIPEEESAPSEEEEVGEWAVPEEESAPSEEEEVGEWAVPEEEEAPSEEEEVGEWAISDEESPAFEETSASEEPQSFEESPSVDEMDWGNIGEEPSTEGPFEEHAMPEDTASEDDELFNDTSPKDKRPKEEPFALDDEEPYELPPIDEKEYEVRPAALERAKRRKSKSKILVPLLALLVISAVAAALYFFFISGEKEIKMSAPEKTAPPVAKIPDQIQDTAPAPEKKSVAQPKTQVPSAPAPSAKKAVSPAPSAEKIYYVQFGAFRSKDNAIKFQKEIKDSGYDTFIKELTSKGDTLYLVLLSDKFSDKWTAFKQARQIKEASDIGTAVHME